VKSGPETGVDATAARLYTLPDEPPEVYVSGFGPQSTQFAAEVGDGYVSTTPGRDLARLCDRS